MSYLELAKKIQSELRAEGSQHTHSAPVAADRPAGLSAQEIIDIDAGKISAVLIDCDFGPLWFAFNDEFQPGDEHPVFFVSELPFLRQMTPDELRRRYTEKQALGGGWIRGRIDERVKR
jgi:hypothetical protein